MVRRGVHSNADPHLLELVRRDALVGHDDDIDRAPGLVVNVRPAMSPSTATGMTVVSICGGVRTDEALGRRIEEGRDRSAGTARARCMSPAALRRVRSFHRRLHHPGSASAPHALTAAWRQVQIAREQRDHRANRRRAVDDQHGSRHPRRTDGHQLHVDARFAANVHGNRLCFVSVRRARIEDGSAAARNRLADNTARPVLDSVVASP